MNTPFDAQPDIDAADFFAGWTDEEIDAYAREVEARDAEIDWDAEPGGPDYDSEPPF